MMRYIPAETQHIINKYDGILQKLRKHIATGDSLDFEESEWDLINSVYNTDLDVQEAHREFSTALHEFGVSQRVLREASQTLATRQWRALTIAKQRELETNSVQPPTVTITQKLKRIESFMKLGIDTYAFEMECGHTLVADIGSEHHESLWMLNCTECMKLTVDSQSSV